jgi:methionyl-tRNA synthetase
LALTNPEERSTAMTVADLVETVNEQLAYGLEPRVRRALEELPSAPPAPAQGLVASLEELVCKQDRHFDLASMSLAQGARLPLEWLRIGRDFIGEPGNNYWWLKGLALLAAPTMPDVASAIWLRVGHFAHPSLREFLEPRPPAPAVAIPSFQPIAPSMLGRPPLAATSESAA